MMTTAIQLRAGGLRGLKGLTGLSIRSISRSSVVSAKGDASTIDSFQLPSQSSINEWEFRYDFIPKILEPKIPPVTKDAIKQDIALEQVKKIELETFSKEANETSRVESSVADVVSGGEYVQGDVQGDAILAKNYSNPDIILNKSKPRKFAGSDKYVQSSINPNVNDAQVINLGEYSVDHKVGKLASQTIVLDDLDADNLQEMQNIYERGERLKREQQRKKKLLIPLGFLGLGVSGYYLYNKEK